MSIDLPYETSLEIRNHCLCLHLQRTARAVARRFDKAFRPFALTNGQFFVMMALNRPEPAKLGDLVPFLAMDRTTLTANLKPLERRALIESFPDASDRRIRRLRLTPDGHELLARAVPVWRAQHDALERILPQDGCEELRLQLKNLSNSLED